jgi:hypothetical protein
MTEEKETGDSEGESGKWDSAEVLHVWTSVEDR